MLYFTKKKKKENLLTFDDELELLIEEIGQISCIDDLDRMRIIKFVIEKFRNKDTISMDETEDEIHFYTNYE
jgi:hypothetical protein